MATANRPPIPVPPSLSKIKDPDTRMAMQALLDGWNVRNGWAGNGDNKFLTKADLEGYLTDPANAKLLSQVTGGGGSDGSGSDGSGSNGNGDGGLASNQIREVSEWIKTTWLWETLHELIPDIYSNTGLKKAVETLSSSVGAVQEKVLTLTDDAVKLFTLLGVSKSDKGVLAISGKYTSFESYIDSELTTFARGEDGIIAKSGGVLAASLDVTTALVGKPAEDLATQYGWPLAGAVTSATNVTTALAGNTAEDLATKYGWPLAGAVTSATNVTTALANKSADDLATQYEWPLAAAVTKAASKITTLETSDEKNRNTLEQALLVTDNTASGAVMAYTLRANVVNNNEGTYTAGFGFSVERIDNQLRSIFLVGADTFAVYDPRVKQGTYPGKKYVLPFIVQDGKVYINEAVVVTLTADKIKGDVNKIMPVKLTMDSWSFPPGRQPGVNWRIIGTQQLPANETHGHTHFAMVTVVGSIPSTPDGLRIQVKIVDANGRDSTVYGYSYTDTKGSVTVSVAGSERSYVGATLQVYALAEFKPGTIESVGGICGGLR